jgi:hypothetical protein
VPNDESKKQSDESLRRAGDRRKRALPVENDKRNNDRRETRGTGGLIDDVILDR